eukprot:7868106-Alexandrium_andersonii.AAC.1
MLRHLSRSFRTLPTTSGIEAGRAVAKTALIANSNPQHPDQQLGSLARQCQRIVRIADWRI